MPYQAKNEPGDTIGAWYKFGCKNGDKFTVSLIISTLTTGFCKVLGALKFKRKPGRLSGRARSCGVGLR